MVKMLAILRLPDAFPRKVSDFGLALIRFRSSAIAKAWLHVNLA